MVILLLPRPPWNDSLVVGKGVLNFGSGTIGPKIISLRRVGVKVSVSQRGSTWKGSSHPKSGRNQRTHRFAFSLASGECGGVVSEIDPVGNWVERE